MDSGFVAVALTLVASALVMAFSIRALRKKDLSYKGKVLTIVGIIISGIFLLPLAFWLFFMIAFGLSSLES